MTKDNKKMNNLGFQLDELRGDTASETDVNTNTQNSNEPPITTQRKETILKMGKLPSLNKDPHEALKGLFSADEELPGKRTGKETPDDCKNDAVASALPDSGKSSAEISASENVRDGRRAVAITFFYTLATFLNFGNARTLGIFFKTWKEEFGVTPAVSSWIPSSAFAFLSIFVASTPFLDIFLKPRTITIVGGLIAGLSFISASQSSSFAQLLASVIIAYSGNGLVHSCLFVGVSRWTVKYRPLAIGIGNTGSSIGSMVLPPLYEWIATELNWRASLLVAAALFFHHMAGGFVVKRFEKRAKAEKTIDGQSEKISFRDRIDASILQRPEFLLLTAYMFFHFGPANGVAIYQPALSDANDVSSRDKAWLATILGTADLVGRLSSSIICTIPTVRKRLLTILTVSEVLSAIGALLLSYCQTYTHILWASIFYGYFYGTWFTVFFSFLAEMASPSQVLVASSVVYFFGGLSTLSLPTGLGAAAADGMGRLTSVFWLFSISLFVGASILVAIMILKVKRITEKQRTVVLETTSTTTTSTTTT